MPEFKDLSSSAGLTALNTHLSTRSYVDGFQPSQSDVALLSKISASIDSKQYPHAARWLTHITSFKPCARSSWFGTKPAAATAGGKPVSGKPEAKKAESDDDSDLDMNLSDDENDDDAQALIAKRNAEKAAAAKAAKVGRDTSKMGKSTLVLDVKPEDSETDLTALDAAIREIAMEGLIWGPTERVPVAYGISKLRIGTVVVDDLVSIDELQERIEEIDGVQSTDIAAFNKI